nr:MAG TPA: lipase [Caudoviricetes sp.]
MFLYQNYGDFSGDIEYLYTEIVNRLKFKGLIN